MGHLLVNNSPAFFNFFYLFNVSHLIVDTRLPCVCVCVCVCVCDSGNQNMSDLLVRGPKYFFQKEFSKTDYLKIVRFIDCSQHFSPSKRSERPESANK